MTRRVGGRRTVLIASAVTVVGVMPAFLTGAVAVQMRADLGFSTTVLGMTMTTFLGGVAVTTLVFGRTVDRLGAARSMRASALIAASVALGIAVTPRWEILIALLFVAGTGQGIGQTATNVFIVQSVDAQRRGLAFGVKQSSQPVAALLGGLAVPLIALQVGWRWAYVAAAVVAVALCVTIPSFPEIRRTGADLAVALSRSRLGLLVACVAFGFAIAAAMSISVFLVDASVVAGIDPSVAGLLLSAGGFASVVARLAAGEFADRHPAVGLRTVAHMILGGCVGYALLATGALPLVVIGTLLTFGLGWGFVGLFFHTLLRLYPDAPGSVSAIGLAGGSIGGAVGPFVFGIIVEQFGYVSGWLALGGAGLLSGLLMLRATRMLHGFEAVASAGEGA